MSGLSADVEIRLGLVKLSDNSIKVFVRLVRLKKFKPYLFGAGMYGSTVMLRICSIGLPI